jgi:hypothetical protein
MFNLHTATREAVRFVINNIDLNINTINKQVVPGRNVILANNGVIVPTPKTFQNEAMRIYESLFATQSMVGVVRWLQVMKVLQSTGGLNLNTVYDWLLVRKLLQEVMPIIQVDEYSIPLARPRDNNAEIRMVTVNDYISFFPNSTPADFFRDVVQIILFGFPVNQTTVEALRLEATIQPYVQYCLRGGKALTHLQKLSSIA